MNRLCRVMALTIAQAACKHTCPDLLAGEPLPALSHGTWFCRGYLDRRGIFRCLSSLFADPGNQFTCSKASS